MVNQKFFELPQEKQKKIINGALYIFARNKYKTSSTALIAERAGVSKALLFHYFGTKKDLYIYIYQYAEKFVISEMSRFHDYNKTDFFDILIDAQICKTNILNVCPDVMLFLVMAYAEDSEEVKSSIHKNFYDVINHSSERFLTRADTSKFKDGVNPREVLNIVLWMADGFMKEKLQKPQNNLLELNEEYLKYIDILRSQFYKDEYI